MLSDMGSSKKMQLCTIAEEAAYNSLLVALWDIGSVLTFICRNLLIRVFRGL